MAGVAIGAAVLPLLVTGVQSIAVVTGAPAAASTAAVLKANAAIATAFGSKASFFAVGELGGGYSDGGVKAQISTASFEETVDLSKLASRQSMVVGVYNGDNIAGSLPLTSSRFPNGARNAAPSPNSSFHP